MADPPIDVYVGASGGLLWRADDVQRLRVEQHIMGDAVGTMPKHSAQNQYLSVPLALSADEISYGVASGKLRLIRDVPADYPLPDADAVASFFAEREKAAQLALPASSPKPPKAPKMENSRKRPLEGDDDCERPAKARKDASGSRLFVRGVWKRLFGGLAAFFRAAFAPRAAVVAKVEKLKVKDEPKAEHPHTPEQERIANTVVTSCAAIPGERSDVDGELNESALDSMTAAVYRNLRGRGFTLTSGAKFGAELLAYPGDPALFHGTLAVNAMSEDEPVNLHELVAVGRLSDATRKRAAWVMPDMRVLGVQWEENLP